MRHQLHPIANDGFFCIQVKLLPQHRGEDEKGKGSYNMPLGGIGYFG